jgi:PPK2 family polyphosphate:nucleotide phosphotransferase
MDLEERFRVPAKGFDLDACDPADKAGLKKGDAEKLRATDLARLADLQERLYAESRRSLLVVLQAMDAAGKDGTIEHVMSGLNPQGVSVTSFKQPSSAELAHDFLWRAQLALPARGRIGVFNRSHYEEVLVVRVHPEYLGGQGIDPERGRGKALWRERFQDISTWERHLARDGTRVVKFFLDVSRDEQRKRFLARADETAKNWKFSAGDVAERSHWDAYREAYADMLRHTSTADAPWYVVPADHKWVTRTVVASILATHLEAMDPRFPTLSHEDEAAMDAAVAALRDER